MVASTNGCRDLSSEMEVDAFRRLFPLRYYERHFLESIRPDGRLLMVARDTTLALGAVASAHGSAMAKIGSTTMLAAIKMEIMTPSVESPEEGCIAINFHMPPICSKFVRPGRPAEAAPVYSKQLSDIILSSGMVDLKELSLISGKSAWMLYLDIYCLDADGALFDAALLSAVGAFSHLEIPLVGMKEDDGGRMVIAAGDKENEAVNKEKRKLRLSSKKIPWSLTFALHNDKIKSYMLVDPNGEEESIMDTHISVILNSSAQLISLYKLGGSLLVSTTIIKDCVVATRQRVKELEYILQEAISDMDLDR